MSGEEGLRRFLAPYYAKHVGYCNTCGMDITVVNYAIHEPHDRSMFIGVHDIEAMRCPLCTGEKNTIYVMTRDGRALYRRKRGAARNHMNSKHHDVPPGRREQALREMLGSDYREAYEFDSGDPPEW